MTTKLFKSMNIIRCVSGANLNLFRYAAMVVVLLTLGVGNAWGGHGGKHTGKVTFYNATGNGTVYLATSSSGTSGGTATNANQKDGYVVQTWTCSETDESDKKTYWPKGAPSAGYYYAGWTTASNSTSGYSTSSYSANAQNDTDKKLYGYFKPVTVTGASSNVTINVEDASAVYPTDASARTLSFTTANSNALADFTYSPANGKTGKFTFSEWTRVSATQTTVKYQFQGTAGDWGGVNRTIEQNVTLTSKGTGGGSATCKITVKYPNVRITDVTADENINVTFDPNEATQAGVVKTVVFDVEYCDGTNNFDTPTFSGTGASHFGGATMSYANGKLTVNYTYSGNKEEATHVATLTLKVKDAIGGTDATYGTKSVTITAQNAPIATDDAKVIAANGVTELYKGTWAGALAEANKAANAGCTLWLLRDVTGLTAPQEVKNTMTLDLNSFTLSGTLTSAGGLLKLNTAGKILTITDAVSGGTISVNGNIDGRISAIEVLQGSLILTKGDLIAENANTGTTLANIYAAGVYLGAGATMGMTGGTVTANRTGASGNYCYGIYCAGTGSSASSVNLTGGTVTATFPNGSYAEGVFAAGNSIISNMTVTASSKTTCYAIRVEDGHLVVNGGIFTATTTNQEARGLYSMNAPSNKNAVVVNNATFNVTAGTTDARGIWCRSTTTTMTGDPTDANVILSGVTVNAKTDETTGTTDAYAIMSDAGVCLGIQSGTYTATTKTQNTYALHTSGYTAVVDGTFNANSTTRTAFAIYVNGGITAVKAGTFTASAATAEVHATKILANAKLLTYGGTFRGICTNVASDGWATGSQVMSTGTLEAQGGTFIGEIAKTGLGAAQLSYGVGIYANTGSNVSLSSATLRGQTDNTYLNGGHAFYTKTANAVNITNCTLEVSGQYQYGYGIRNNGTPLSVKNSEITVNTQYAYNYGIYQEGNTTTNVENTTITCEANSVRAHAIWVNNGQVNATNCSLTAKTKQATATAEAESNLRAVYVNTGKKVTLNGCTVTAKGNANYSQNGYGLYIDGSADIDNTIVTVSDVKTNAYAIGNTANTTLIAISSGKFSATAAGGTVVSSNGTAAATKQQLYGGYYKQNTNLAKYLPTGYGIETLPTTAAEYGEGYRYAIRPSTNVDPVCKIGSTPYYTLEEALEFVNKNSGTANTIVMVKDYTLPAGNYTLPANATLLVPYKSDQTTVKTTVERTNSAYVKPSKYRKLTFANGVRLTALGVIQAGGVQSDLGQGITGQPGSPTGPYGQLQLDEGSEIILEGSSAKLYAWGFVTGKGTIDARKGSSVYEMFQIRDWKGGSCSHAMIDNNKKIMPMNQYYIQNVEATTTYRPGSNLITATAVNLSVVGNVSADDVKVIGTSKAMFLMSDVNASEDTWVRKSYDAVHDKQIYEINTSANIGDFEILLENWMQDVQVKTKNYVLPIPNNMKIHLLSGKMEITQDIELLPGAEIEIDKEATVYLNSGKRLFLYDVDQWKKSYTGWDSLYIPVKYSPSWTSGTTCPRNTTLEDAAMNVHGSFHVRGSLYTTNSGANIFSSNEDAGQIVFEVAAASADATVYQVTTTSASATDPSTTNCHPAYLKNGDGTYEHTAGTALGKTWIYTDDKWKCWEADGCFIRDAQNNPYAKPADYVRLTSDEQDANHLYKAYESDRYFIWDASCQWWEIDPSLIAAGEYKAIMADHNGKYNYYEYDSANKYWKIKLVTITWKNGSTTLGTYSNVGYKTIPKYLDAIPTKSVSSTEYYTWIGWLKDDSEEGEFFAKDAELPFANANTTYYAVFETHKYSYAVVFKNYDGSVLQTSSWEAGQVPYYLGETDPVKPATAAKIYTFTGWSPELTAVTGAGKVYTAQFDPGTPRTYTVQWVNYNGTVLKEEQVAYGTTPSAPVTPTRPNDTYYTYTFNEWTPAVSSVTGNQTYTATYNYEKMVTKYAITFKNGSETVYTQNLPDGETPVFDGTTPTKPADAQYTYTFDGWSATEGGEVLASLPAVSGAAQTYYAHFATTTNAYTIRWKSIDGKQLYETDENVGYGSTPTYNSSKPTKARQGATVYTFDGWSSSVGGAKIALPSVTSDATYYAHFTDDPVYTVTFDANGHGTAPATQEVVQNQLVIKPADPAIAEWIFGGWYKEPGCTNAWIFASDVITADKTLYAKWTQAVATVTANDVTENYTSITDAFTAAKAKTNPTIKLLQDVSMGATTLTYDGANNCTLDLNGNEISGTARILFKVDNANAVFIVTDLTESKLGKLSLSTAPTDKAGYCANLVSGTLKLEAGTFYIRSTSTNQNAVGARVDGGEFIMNGGTVHTVVTVSSRVGHGVQPLGTANAIVNGGTVRVESAGQGYGMYVTGTMTVNGGKFHITASSTAEVAHSNASDPTKLFIKGGYYNINTNLAKCVAAPDHVLNTTAAEKVEVGNDYNYKVAEAYTVTFMNGSVSLQSGPVEKGVKPAYAGTPTKDADVQYSYTFDGWTVNPDGSGTVYTASTLPVVGTAAATYYAHYSKTEQKYSVNVTSGGHGSVSPASVSNIGCKTASGDITATPDAGYSFSGWTLPTGVTAATGYNASSNPIRINATATGSITANFTANTGTAYTVEHYWQNIDNDDYTKHETEGKTGTTDAATAAVAMSYTGFTAKPFAQGTIAGDGSTVVNIYYNRDTYTITWVDGNGTTIETDEHVKYGATPSYDGETPTKTATAQYAYLFSGWDSEIVAVTEEKTYTAQFSSTPQTYNVTLHTNEGTINSGNVESYTYGEGATLPTNIERVGFDFAGWYDNSELTGDAVTAIPVDAIGAKEYWANWTVTQCTITWKNYDGTPLCDPTIVEWGGEPAYPSHLGTPTRGSDPNLTYTFKDWSPAIHAANGNETYTAQYYMSITTGEPGTYTVSGTEDAVVTTVQVSGALHVPEGNTLTTNDLIVEASSDGSGAIDGIGNVTVTGDAYFDYEFDVDPWHWSAFGVPFEIDLDAAAPLKEKTEALGILSPDDYDIVYYDTEERANNGASKNCWKYVDNETHRLIPGRLYMIAFDKHVGHVGVLRFKKAASAPVNYTTPVELITTGSAGGDNNWNGIANPMMYHALLGAGVKECQVHDGGEIGKDGYYTYDMNNKKFFVGKAAFVQVPQNQAPIVVTQATDENPIVLHAPRRTKASVATDNRYDVQIASTDGAAADRLLILAEEDKADEYVIVSDLAKAGVSPVRAQMWVDRYGEKLCKNTTAYINNKANYPLVISAPTAGEYEIFINELPDNETTLYLTYNGKAIWNLNYSAYAANLEKGTTNNYGLRMVRVPKVGTGIEEATIQNGDAVRKVIVEDKVFIIRNGEMYSITGQKAQ